MKDQLRVSPLPPKELGKLLAEIRQIAYEKTMAAIDKHNSEQEIAARAAESAPQEVDNAGAEVAEAAAAVMGQKSSSSEKGYYLHLKGK
ncbi:MAG: hypothetical protein LBF15_02625 [Candidatus Peribacteria bacterium]|jgi:hypothetical protein|nr:hypothetical protein [Candidatus Peribacteria bacterium]